MTDGSDKKPMSNRVNVKYSSSVIHFSPIIKSQPPGLKCKLLSSRMFVGHFMGFMPSLLKIDTSVEDVIEYQS